MTMRRLLVPLGVLLALLVPRTAPGQTTGKPRDAVSLDVLCQRTGANVRERDRYGRVVLSRGARAVTIAPGMALVLLGEQAIPVREAPRRAGSMVWIPSESAALIERYLRPSAHGLPAAADEPPEGRAQGTSTATALVLIDPGHGGRDPGAHRGGAEEKAIVLAVGRALRDTLERRGIRARLTRDGDQSLGASQDASLAARTDIARDVLPDAFVSLHVDATASEASSARGFTVYVPPPDFRERRLANQSFDVYRRGLYTARRRAFRGRAIGRSGEVRGDLAGALYGLFFEDAVSRSSSLGRAIEAELAAIPGMRSRGVRENDLYVLKWGWGPSVLVELGYLNNPEERRRLLSPAHEEELAEALSRGIDHFLGPRARRVP